MSNNTQLPADKELILEKHCPSMSPLYLDDMGRAFRERILAAMDDFTDKVLHADRNRVQAQITESEKKYATKLHQVEQEIGGKEEAVKMLQKTCEKYYAEIGEIKAKCERYEKALKEIANGKMLAPLIAAKALHKGEDIHPGGMPPLTEPIISEEDFKAWEAEESGKGGATIADYEEVLADHRRLVQKLDELINGPWPASAKQPTLCDIVKQIESEGLIIKKKSTDDWICVDDRLPEESGRYWCYVEHLTDLGLSYFQWNCDYNAQLRRFSDMTLTKGEHVTHWRNLPPPPEKG